MNTLAIFRDTKLLVRIRLDPRREQYRIGRRADNDIALGDPRISLLHARIERRRVSYQLIDLRSTNGTRLDGRRVITPSPIRAGQRIRIGPYTLRTSFETGAAHATPTPIRCEWNDPGTSPTIVDLGARRSRAGTSATWAELRKRVWSESRDRQWFLGPVAERALERLANTHNADPEKLVAIATKLAVRGRDRALATLSEWEPPDPDTDVLTAIRQAVEHLHEEAEPDDEFSRLGLAYVVSHLERHLPR